ncbi:MAG: DUF115 domain-containing protein [Spirochaetia bacterium]|nr:DUF115 domain-containing protein [Spirochaetia bacterium]
MPEKTGLFEVKGKLGHYLVGFQNGQYQISIRDENPKKKEYRPLISLRDSIREAHRILGNFILKKGNIAIIYGAGSLPLVQILVEQKKEKGGELIIFEADPFLAKHLVETYNHIYKDIPFITPNNLANLSDFLELYSAENMTGYRIISLASLKNLMTSFYEDAEKIFKNTFSSLISDLLTRLEFEPNWIYNSLAQITNFSRAWPVNELFNKGAGYTAVLVSTGPSLRLSLDWLKSIQDKVFIACVDSAYRVLHRYKIKPHLIISLDAQPYTLRHFLGLSMGNEGAFPILYADVVSNPQVVFRWRGPLLFGVTAQYKGSNRVVTPGCDFVEDEVLKKNYLGDIQSGGSVATSLFDLLRLMNFDRIILTGQDLAYSFREIHTMGTHHSDLWFSSATHRLESIENINDKITRRRHTIYENSITGKKILADYVLSIYRGWFSASAEKISKNVFNMTKEGLIIDNIPTISNEEFNQFKLKGIDLKNFILDPPKNKILLSKEIFNFYTSIENSSFSLSLLEKYKFLEKIGRKFLIKALRSEISEEEKNNLIQKQQNEQNKFWQMLIKKSRVLKKLNKSFES